MKMCLVHGLTIAAFPLQLISLGYFCSRDDGFISLVLLSIVAHVLYFIRVIKRGENQYKPHFFYYQIFVAVVQSLMLYTDFYSSFIDSYQFWILVAPLSVQVATCYTTYLDNQKTESEGASAHVINEEDDVRFKKGLVNVVTMIAFPLQLVFYGLTIAFYPAIIAVFGSIILMIVSVVANIRYFLRVIRKGENEYKYCFFYHQLFVALIQFFIIFTFPIYFVLPLIVQVIACSALYFHSEKSPSDGLPSYIEAVKQREEGEKKIPI